MNNRLPSKNENLSAGSSLPDGNLDHATANGPRSLGSIVGSWPAPSRTGTSPREISSRIGTELSTRGLETLRALAEEGRLHEASDKALQEGALAKLKQLGSLSMSLKETAAYGEGGYLGTETVPTILSCNPADRIEGLKMVEWLLKPCPDAVIVTELQKLKYKTAMRSTENEDWKFKMLAYAEELVVYPEHAVKAACSDFAKIGTFFPTMKDFHEHCGRRTKFLKALQEQLRAAQESPIAIETIGHYREIPRHAWKPCHFLQKIEDMIGFANVHKREHRATDELEYLYTAQKFIEEVLPRLTEKDPERMEIYRHIAEIKPRVEILEKRLREPDEKTQAA
jgi:hypothetical protein